jgi:uncharacterized secreted protein with C-terminal beta-propeller domain
MNQLFHRLFIFGLAGLVHFGCSGEDKGNGASGGGDENGDFTSANPSQPGGRNVDDGAGSPATGSTGSGGSTSNGGESPGAAGNGGDDPERAIEEADIIQQSGNRLYALSQYGGLSAIDIGTRDELRLLGRYKTDATPFEMYLRDGDVVLGLFNSYGTYLYDEDEQTYTWIQTSRVVALDVSDPAHIEELASFNIPGSISDSRIVGNVLYVVGYEETGCWGCGDSPATTILSLDISNPLEVTKVDTLRYEDAQTDYGWMRRSVTATDERMYVAGVEYSTTGVLGSTIHVVDISDPSGTVAEVAQAEAEGQITSRWQMDEYDGVLRVISQPPNWDLAKPPVVQTWSIGQDDSLTPLGRTPLVLPRQEQLQSVRFDGPRGYAITFERTDPLFTVDLSDPATPVQKGELEMPGFLYYMQPQGDRLIGLGFDQGNPEGSLTVSLFDVSDLSAPAMLDRVNFGGDWGSLSEDQDRIHKAFSVLDEIGTILVPYSGYDYDANGYCGDYNSGVQIIDYAAQTDELTLRGAAKSRGQARRGILHDDRLLTVSDDRVQSFDIDDRDAPAETASVTLTTNVSKSVIVGDHVVRLTNDWWTSSPRLEVVALANAEDAVPLGELDLGSVFDSQRSSCYSWSYPRELFANDTYAYLVYDTYAYYYDGGSETKNRVGVVVVDVSDPSEPKFVAKHEILRSGYPGSYYGYGYGLASSGKDVVQIGSTLGVLSTNSECANPECTYSNTHTFVDVVDLSDPATPRSKSLTMPVGLGTTGLVTSGNVIALSHYVALDSAGNRVRFFLDRIDVSDPAQPVMATPKNVPGSLLAYDADENNAVTVDYQAVTERKADYNECYEKYGWYAQFEYDDQQSYTGPGTCYAIRQSLKLVGFSTPIPIVRGSYELDPGRYVGLSATGDDRTFVTMQNTGYYYGGVGEGYGLGWSVVQDFEMPVIVLAGLRSGDFAVGELEVQGGDYWSASALQASGQRAILSAGWRGKLSVVDGADAASPSVVKEVEIHGYVSDLDVAGDRAVISLGLDGAQLVDLE